MCLLLTGCSAGERLWNKAWDAHHWTPWWRTRSTQRVLLLRMERRLEYPTVGPLLSLFLSQTHTAAHLSTKLSRYTFTHSTHTHTYAKLAQGRSEELTRAPNIKWTQAFYISSSNGNWQQKPWNMTFDKNIYLWNLSCSSWHSECSWQKYISIAIAYTYIYIHIIRIISHFCNYVHILDLSCCWL